MELMFIVVREASKLLARNQLLISCEYADQSRRLTFGLLTGWLVPAKRPIGWTWKLVDIFGVQCRRTRHLNMHCDATVVSERDQAQR